MSQQNNGGYGGGEYDNTSFNVQYLGAAMLSQMSTGLGTLQKPLKDLYFSYQKPSGPARLNANLLTVTRKGLVVSQVKHAVECEYATGATVFYAMPSIHFWDTVRFVAVREKDKKYKCAFESLSVDLSRNMNNLYFPLDYKKEKHLTKVVSHPVLFAIVLRRPTGLKALDLHAFVCSTDSQAMTFMQHLNSAHSTFADNEAQESGVFGYNLFGGNSGELQNSAARDDDPRVNQRRPDVARSASYLGTPSAGMSFPQLPPRPIEYALTQSDLIGGGYPPRVPESEYGYHRDFNPHLLPPRLDSPQRSAVNRSYTVYQTQSEVFQPNPAAIGFDRSLPHPRHQNQFERFGEQNNQLYGNHKQLRQNPALSEFSTRPVVPILIPPARYDIYGQLGQQANRQGPYDYTQSLGELSIEANQGEPKEAVPNSSSHFASSNSFDARPAAPMAALAQKHSTSPSYRRKFPPPDPADNPAGIYRPSPTAMLNNRYNANKVVMDMRHSEPLPQYNNWKPLPELPHPNFPGDPPFVQNRPLSMAVPDPTPVRLPPPAFEDNSEQQPPPARKSVFGIFPREAAVKVVDASKSYDRGGVVVAGDVRGGKPIALVQPRKVQGIRVLPLTGEDIYGQLQKPDVKRNIDNTRRPLANENQRIESVYSAEPPRSKPLASEPVRGQRNKSAAIVDNSSISNSNKEENTKDKEIASIFGNINFDNTLSPPQHTNFESSLGYLP